QSRLAEDHGGGVAQAAAAGGRKDAQGARRQHRQQGGAGGQRQRHVQAAGDQLGHRPVIAQRRAQVSPHQAAQPVPQLHQHRPVVAQQGADPLHGGRVAVGPHDQPGRVAGQDAQGQESDGADQEGRDQQAGQAAQQPGPQFPPFQRSARYTSRRSTTYTG